MACRRVASSSLNLLVARHGLSRLGCFAGRTNQSQQSRTLASGPLQFGILQPFGQQSSYPNFVQVRWRKKKAPAKNEVSDDMESDDEDETESNKGQEKTSKVVVTSLRADLIVKACFGLARNKVEVLFYEGKIQVNDEKLRKKSEMVKIGDVIDVVQGASPENPEMFNIVSRVEIVDAHEKDQERLNLLFTKYPKLIVPKK